MLLVVDASTLVAEALRARGRRLLLHEALELAVAAEAWSETRYELRRRARVMVRRANLEPVAAEAFVETVTSVLESRILLFGPDVYSGRLQEAIRRIPRDHTDAPTVALALTLDCGIWTQDRDFFGCGLPTWTTDTLQGYLNSYA